MILASSAVAFFGIVAPLNLEEKSVNGGTGVSPVQLQASA
jgi:hypothetical protein